MKIIKLKRLSILLTMLIFMVFSTCSISYATEPSDGSSEPTEAAENNGVNFEISSDQSVDLDGGTIINDSSYDIEVGGDESDAAGNMQMALNGFLSILTGAASVMLVFGLGKMFLSFKDERPEEKVQATMFILAAILIFSIRGLVDKVIESN